jgi:Xaa-Pro aminopeptidase
MIGRYFPLEEYEARWRRVDDAMRAESIDLAVVWSRSAGTYDRCADLLYLTNFYGNQPGQGRRGPAGFAAAILRVGEKPELFADVSDPRPELISTDRIHACGNTFEDVARYLATLGHRKVALVGTDLIPMKYWQVLQAGAPDIEWQVHDELVRTVRLLKSSRELDAFRTAGQTVTAALEAAMAALREGRSESEAAGEAARIVYQRGGHIHMMPISHGPYLAHVASDPLAGFSQERPNAGDFVRTWVTGPMFQGYWLGPGRTVVSGGRATAAQLKLLEDNAAVVSEIAAVIRPGATVRTLVETGDRARAARGLELSALSREWPLYGHGNGLFFEAPTISTRVGNDAGFALRENMVISIEVFVQRAGVGESGFENNFIVTGDGAELLSPAALC